VDRIAAAKGHVEKVKSALISPAAQTPCINCRYFEIVCTHPAASKITVSPVSGKTRIEHFAAEKIRADDGACGPEGALFDSRSLPGLVVVGALTSKPALWIGFGCLAVLADWLLR
jgi:hypothetical protein